MPGKHIASATSEPCEKCKENLSVLVVRAKPLCHDCFARYVHTKAIKRLESFRVNFAAGLDQQRKILLPLSHGVSSTTLLHILDLHLKTQRSKTNRTGFAIVVLHVDEGSQDADLASRLDQVQQQYSDHEYTSLPLHDVFRLLPEDAYLRGLVPGSDSQADVSPQAQLTSIISSLTSATARADVLSTLRTRLIVEYAKQASCESILWGDSTTRLAEKTLSETAKGRGFSLPWQVSDGRSPFDINFHYPLRDVLKKELFSYVDLASYTLSSLVHEPSSGATQASTSSKNTTIDDLMKQYFESVEENFPSIVSNVVRTTGKLEIPAGAMSDPSCTLCGMPVPNGRFGIHGWGGDQHDGLDDAMATSSRSLCYGCTRSAPQASTNSKST
ncbi:cytoplasmic tRNA 2-thiolation protein 2 [Phaeosphaeria sp. MPI-PUGE-AT-0046c]|nr:cytoplasmic tRNA 2-thiolation protein 2 [Phaeosphaeria sp. MPI-PUGE-AT-0046c]